MSEFHCFRSNFIIFGAQQCVLIINEYKWNKRKWISSVFRNFFSRDKWKFRSVLFHASPNKVDNSFFSTNTQNDRFLRNISRFMKRRERKIERILTLWIKLASVWPPTANARQPSPSSCRYWRIPEWTWTRHTLKKREFS